MKAKEIKNLDMVSLDEKLQELKKELIKLNAQIAVGTTIKNPGQVRSIKKRIALILAAKSQAKKGDAEKTQEVSKKQ